MIRAFLTLLLTTGPHVDPVWGYNFGAAPSPGRSPDGASPQPKIDFESKRLASLESEEGQVNVTKMSEGMAGGFRMPKRIHPYSTSATSMYLAQDSPIVAPRAFKVDQLPSTPQLNAIMDRAMGKVKSLLKELEDDKGKNCTPGTAHEVGHVKKKERKLYLDSLTKPVLSSRLCGQSRNSFLPYFALATVT